MQEAVARLEAGEDPETIEQQMGDVLEQERGRRNRGDAGGQRRDHAGLALHHGLEVLQIGLDDLVDERVLNLDRHLEAIAHPRPVNLADGRRGLRFFLKTVKKLFRRVAELRFDNFTDF